MEGPDTVAAVFVEPVQNAAAASRRRPGYFERLREIRDTHNVLLVADEVICAYGRLGTMSAHRSRYQPDIITSAKGLTPGTRRSAPRSFPTGSSSRSARARPPSRTVTRSAATRFPAPRPGQPRHLRVRRPARQCAAQRESVPLNTGTPQGLPIVGDVLGDGYFFGVELVKDQATKATFTKEESERILRDFVSTALFDRGLYSRADDRGDTVVQVAPPLISGRKSSTRSNPFFDPFHRRLGIALILA